jgi:type IV fimbrial biogenesis protein FimT
MAGLTIVLKTRNSAGVTLIELLVVMAIAAVLLAVGVPNLRSYFITNALATTTNEFHAALNLARSEALKRSAPVSIRRAGATSQKWSDGWTIFLDSNENGTKDGDDVLIQSHGPVPGKLSLYADAAAANSITFKAQGQSTGGVFVMCYDGQLTADGGSRSRAVLVSSSGRVRVGEDTNNDKVPEIDSGANVASCTNPVSAS